MMPDHEGPLDPNGEGPSSADDDVPDLPEQEDLEAQMLVALTPAELQEGLRVIPPEIRQQLLSKLRIAGARTPTVLQCRQILATLGRKRKAHHMFLHTLAVGPAFYLRQAADELEEALAPAAAFRGAIDHLLEEGRPAALVRLAAYDLAIHSGKDLYGPYLAILLGHPPLRLPDWPEGAELDFSDEALGSEPQFEAVPDGFEAHLTELRALS